VKGRGHHRNTGTFEGKMAETQGSTTVSTKLGSCGVTHFALSGSPFEGESARRAFFPRRGSDLAALLFYRLRDHVHEAAVVGSRAMPATLM
jgi:hypothetical protein